MTQFGRHYAKEELERRCLGNARFFSQWLGFERALAVESLSDRCAPEYRQARQLRQPGINLLEAQLSKERAEIVRAAIDCLRPRDAKFLRLRHGIEGSEHTLEEIGRAENLTRERVRQILQRAEDRLRFLLRNHWQGNE